MDTPTETVEETGAVLPNPQAVVPNALQEVNVVFMGPVVDGYFQPVPDKLNTPPRWEQGSYSITAGKWPTPGLSPNLMDLTRYNGYSILVMASAWDKEVISQARIFGVLTNMASDVIAKFAYASLQEKEEEIAAYISGISN
ncbi:hypothetical protein CLV24_11583 [Pontibacter ummariensis]|uniref:Uncharacterized protein n=1 Tax=Pontibacter ummariensis TaxID=1610492 RepID=A0A239I1Z7_9BACT|nr:hypothetical protein [Pontibacter ummariensis]PRY10166.1 hypothetical protein CLV24_11583 [Pontibacter ummariensis]SNS87278.1 hypothetical protein SAMN06296052_11583 [Pontibacter ummariensis]